MFIIILFFVSYFLLHVPTATVENLSFKLAILICNNQTYSCKFTCCYLLLFTKTNIFLWVAAEYCVRWVNCNSCWSLKWNSSWNQFPFFLNPNFSGIMNSYCRVRRQRNFLRIRLAWTIWFSPELILTYNTYNLMHTI